MATIGEKADYVRRAPQTRLHHCHWPGCPAQVPPAKLGCRRHWYRLPPSLRSKIWAAFQPGQEIDGTPSRRYLHVAREVHALIEAWVEEHGE